MIVAPARERSGSIRYIAQAQGKTQAAHMKAETADFTDS
jgi:hypothetical protein